MNGYLRAERRERERGRGKEIVSERERERERERETERESNEISAQNKASVEAQNAKTLVIHPNRSVSETIQAKHRILQEGSRGPHSHT